MTLFRLKFAGRLLLCALVLASASSQVWHWHPGVCQGVGHRLHSALSGHHHDSDHWAESPTTHVGKTITGACRGAHELPDADFVAGESVFAAAQIKATRDIADNHADCLLCRLGVQAWGSTTLDDSQVAPAISVAVLPVPDLRLDRCLNPACGPRGPPADFRSA